MKIFSIAGITLFSLILFASCNQTSQKSETNAVISQPPAPKCILKASNNNYVSIASDKMILSATETDIAKAEVFELIDLGQSKTALKMSNGKFISADQGNGSNLFANRDRVGDWEAFEIIKLDQTKANIKASNGKFVSADRNINSALIANRDQPGDWETFTIEPK